MNIQQKMLFDERNGNAYSERLANQVQMKLNNAPFKPHNFKLAYDLDAYETTGERTPRSNMGSMMNQGKHGKIQLKMFTENQNNRMFFEAMKLKSLRKQAQRQKMNEINSKNATPPFQTSGKFYHLNFEPMRIEDYRDIDESKINEELPEIPNKVKLQKTQHAVNNNNYFDNQPYSLDSRNNNDINSVDVCRHDNTNCFNINNNNSSNFAKFVDKSNNDDTNNNNNYNNNNSISNIRYNNCNAAFTPYKNITSNNNNNISHNSNINGIENNNSNNNIINNRTSSCNVQSIPSSPIFKSFTPADHASALKYQVTKENFVKKGKAPGRKLPNIPVHHNNTSRLSSIMPDLIATTKAPTVADEIMAVYNLEKQALKKDFVFPICCSPNELFGLEKNSINPDNVRLTIDDLGYPETIDPIKKYSDLYLNEMYVRSIICFLASMTEEMHNRLHEGDGGEDNDESVKHKKETEEENFKEESAKDAYPVNKSPLDIELKIDKASPLPSSSYGSRYESEPFTPDSLSSFVNSSARSTLIETPRKSRKSSASLESGFDEVKRDSSTCSRATDCQSVISSHSHQSDGSDSGSSHFPPGFTDIEFYLDESDATHRGCHKFLPRHPEEIAVEIGDNLYVEKEHDDLWCEGINLRTKKRGIFPTAYATDLSLMGDAPKIKFFVSFLGSIEIGQHNGHDILCKAIKRIISNKNKQKDAPLNLSCLEIDENGIKVSERKKKTPTSRILSTLGKLSLLKNLQESEHVFLLKNITFCGILPSNDKYMGFITKHPVCMKFACHVFLASNSARPIVEAIGSALSRFHQEFLTVAYPVEDIYFE